MPGVAGGIVNSETIRAGFAAGADVFDLLLACLEVRLSGRVLLRERLERCRKQEK